MGIALQALVAAGLPILHRADSLTSVSGAFPSRTVPAAAWRRFAIELALLAALGAFMAAVGPYGSETRPWGVRIVYWLLAIVGGGVIGIAVDRLLERRLPALWPRVLAVSVAMTPGVMLLVFLLQSAMFGDHGFGWISLQFAWQVWVISLLVMAVRALVWRRPAAVVETRTLVVPPLPEAEAAFRRRLSAKRRAARLIAVEAEDHFVQVHTDAGIELLSMRFAEALAELALAHGWRVHRSWWVAADAIEGVRWSRGGGEARLAGGLSVPVSRSNAATLKDAGWR
jgi:hypothetical protein